MSEILVFEIRFFFETILAGFFLGMVYGIFEVCRSVFQHGKVWTAAEDLFYWLFCMGVIAWMLYNKTDGKIRIYAVLGLAIGIVLFRKTRGIVCHGKKKKRNRKKRKTRDKKKKNK